MLARSCGNLGKYCEQIVGQMELRQFEVGIYVVHLTYWQVIMVLHIHKLKRFLFTR